MRAIVRLTCGCTAQEIHEGPDGKPARPGCSIHGCDTVDQNPPALEGRTMVCGYGGQPRPSDPSAAFFRARPDREHDEFYCGCYGWD